MTQIITEDAKDKPTGLPLELLRQLIMASDEVRQEFLMWYLKSAFDTYQKVQDTVQDRLSEVQSAIFSPVDMMKRFLGQARSRLRELAQSRKLRPCANESRNWRRGWKRRRAGNRNVRLARSAEPPSVIASFAACHKTSTTKGTKVHEGKARKQEPSRQPQDLIRASLRNAY